jgi:predicted dithiol-disulfide oxidoreductase (DUF899 family)
MTDHKTGTREEWLAARLELLEAEKELTRRGDELARRRQALPWVRVEKEYRFETDEGDASLADLFRGRSQLLVYHFMFGLEYEAGCAVCSSIADTLDPQVVHLRARDVTLICASHAPLEKLLDYRRRMGWGFDWVSTHDSDFGFDFGFSHTSAEIQHWDDAAPTAVRKAAAMSGTSPAGYMAESPGLMAFALRDGAVYHTYTTTARGVEPLMAYYTLLDRVPNGRDEDDNLAPGWIRRHDEY